jgi:hypothetical protein
MCPPPRKSKSFVGPYSGQSPSTWLLHSLLGMDAVYTMLSLAPRLQLGQTCVETGGPPGGDTTGNEVAVGGNGPKALNAHEGGIYIERFSGCTLIPTQLLGVAGSQCAHSAGLLVRSSARIVTDLPTGAIPWLGVMTVSLQAARLTGPTTQIGPRLKNPTSRPRIPGEGRLGPGTMPLTGSDRLLLG